MKSVSVFGEQWFTERLVQFVARDCDMTWKLTNAKWGGSQEKRAHVLQRDGKSFELKYLQK